MTFCCRSQKNLPHNLRCGSGLDSEFSVGVEGFTAQAVGDTSADLEVS